MVVSSMVECATEDNGQLKRNWAVSLVMVLSQYDPITQESVIQSIPKLQVHGQIENHVTQVAHVICWIALQQEGDKLLNKKGNQTGAAVMGLSQVKTKIMSGMMLAAEQANRGQLSHQQLLSQERFKIARDQGTFQGKP